MRKTIFVAIPFLSVSMVACGSSTTAANDSPAGDEALQEDTPRKETTGDVSTQTDGEPRIDKFTVFTLADGDFPTYLSPLLGSKLHLFPSLTITNPASAAKTVVLRASLAGYSQPSEVTVTLGPGEQKTSFFDAALDYAKLNGVGEAGVASKFEVALSTTDGNVLFASSWPTNILSKNTVLWSGVFSDSHANPPPLPAQEEALAVVSVMTTPHDHWGEIDKVLHEAAPYSRRNSMEGYDGYTDQNNSLADDVNGAADQVGAIYNALKARGYNYTNVPTDFSNGNTQFVRYPAESLRSTTGNCIDGTLVFTSALEAIGMRPFVDFVPHHAFVGVYVTRKGLPNADAYIMVETTMLANSTFQEAANFGLQEDQDNGTANTLFRAEVSVGRDLKWNPSLFPM